MRRLVPAAGAVLVLGPLAVLALLVALPDPAPPAPSDASARQPGSGPLVDPDLRRLLRRAASAADHTSYRGVQFRSAWTSGGTVSEVVEVDHLAGRGTTTRRVGAGENAGSGVTIAGAGPPSVVPGGAVEVLSAHYLLTRAGSGTVAGREADVVVAHRPAGGAGAAPAARFWLDRETGLVLRREVYDPQGRTTRASAFVDLTLGQARVDVASAAAPWAERLGPAALDDLRAEGWHCPATLPGPLQLVDARRGGADGAILHLSYSDGIASVSVFVQRGRLDEAAMAGHRRSGRDGHEVWVRGDVPRRVTWASGSEVYTVVADAPERTVDRVVAALPHRPAEGNTLGRLDRGLDRVASWFNPFG